MRKTKAGILFKITSHLSGHLSKKPDILG